MKRIIASVLLIALFLSISTFALAAFSLRNGYYWGMTENEALSIANEEGLKYIEDEGITTFEEVPVGYFSTTMQLFFLEDSGLHMIYYNFHSIQEDDKKIFNDMFDSLTKSLDDVYGENIPGLKHELVFWELPDTIIMLKKEKVYEEEGMVRCVISYIINKSDNNSGF